MVDKEKAMAAVRLFLEAVGEDPDRPALLGTPDRVARMAQELFGGTDEAAEKALSVTFECSNDDLVLEKDISFYSLCEHHLLPFYGKVHIAYLPNGSVAGLSKLARVVEAYARRAQIQEQLTEQIASAMMRYLKPRGVMVVVEAEHMCMTMRGVKKPGTKTLTYVCKGAFEENDVLCDRVLRMVSM